MLVVVLALTAPMLVTDAREHRLPLPLNLGLLASALVLLPLTSAWTGYLGQGFLLSAALTSGILTLLMLVLFVAARGGLGFGDVILVAGLAAFGGYVSPIATLAGFWLGCLGTLVWAVIRRRRGEAGAVPFGPGLILGTWLVLLVPWPVGA